ncbi:MAG: endonuclease/exonuclease/phosphatase family protein [Planctomycetota bacterium]|nr:endonuclease/exonuclease/phosphatase family protein [Planctomycetota bacterium]MDA1178201.1 endonuclease/exonuclease/phosphatase family protein [Planctomycetota bacterium]
MTKKIGVPKKKIVPLMAFFSLLVMAAEARPQILDTDPIRADEGLMRLRWEDAELAVGTTALIAGKVVKVGQAGRVNFLDFHAHRRDVFKVVIFKDAEPKFPGKLEDLYSGQTIEVRGTVTRYAGVPQLVVRHPDQIRILGESEALPATPSNRAPRRTPTDMVRVATFNVKNLFDAVDDPYTDDETTPTKPRAELEKIARTMRAVDADVWALQEVEDRRYLERFVAAFLPDLDYSQVVLMEGNDGRGIDVAVLSRLPVGPVVSHRHQPFPGVKGRPQRFSRDVLRVTLEPKERLPFEMWVVHLKSNADGREHAEPIRTAEVVALRQIYQTQLTVDPQARILLCGDFNDTVESASLQPLRHGSDAPRTLFTDVPLADRITYSREPYRSMIDFIFAAPGMEPSFVKGSYQIHPLEEADSGSDHRPVSAEFRLQNRTP